MRGPRLFDHTDWKNKKKVYYTFLDVLFCTESISEEKKKSSLFVMKLPTASKALGFSLLSLYVNSALCLQFIVSLSTCDMSN